MIKKLFMLLNLSVTAYAIGPIIGTVQISSQTLPVQSGNFNVQGGTATVNLAVPYISGVQCLHTNTAGEIVGTGADCGASVVPGNGAVIVNVASQYASTYYPVAGSSNTLSGLSPGTAGQILSTQGGAGPPQWVNNLGATSLQNTSSLTAGTTLYVASGTVAGPLTVSTLTVTNIVNASSETIFNALTLSSLNANQCLQTNGTGQVITTGSGCFVGGSFINNQSTLQSGATFYVSSGTFGAGGLNIVSGSSISWSSSSSQPAYFNANYPGGGVYRFGGPDFGLGLTSFQIDSHDLIFSGEFPGSNSLGWNIESKDFSGNASGVLSYDSNGIDCGTGTCLENQPLIFPDGTSHIDSNGRMRISVKGQTAAIDNQFAAISISSGGLLISPSFSKTGVIPSSGAVIEGEIENLALTASQFVKTDASKNLVSYDLLNSTQAWTGQQSWSSASPSTFTALAVTTSLTVAGQNVCQANGTNCPASGGGSFSLNASGNVPITSTATLLAGTNVTLSQSGSTITINSSGGSSTLISSGIAFGSASNTVTQDTNTFTFNDTTKVLTVIGLSSSSIVQTSTYNIVSPTYGTGPLIYVQKDNLQVGANQPTNLPTNGNNGNVLIGNRTGGSEYTTPVDSVYLGNFAGNTSTGATHGVLIGEEAGSFANGGTFNTYMGYQAGAKLQCSVGCTMIGAQAGFNSGGSVNDDTLDTCVGSQSCGGLTGGNPGNTALGYQAMGGFSATGGYDVSIGYQAGLVMQGNNSLSLGHNSNLTNVNAGVDGVTAIGNQTEATQTGGIAIGDGAQSFSDRGIATGAQALVAVNAAGSMAFGYGTTVNGANSVGFGNKDATGSPLVVTTTNTFIIGQIGTNGAMMVVASSMTISSITVSGTLTVAGQNVCQANGTNCPASGGGGGGNTVAASQFSAPYYNVPGSSTSLAAFPGITLSTNTGVTIATVTTLGAAGFSVSISSNLITNGTTFYQNGQAVINGVNSSLWLTGNQSITWTGSGDMTGSASGTTSISPTLTAAAVQANIKVLSAPITMTSSATVTGIAATDNTPLVSISSNNATVLIQINNNGHFVSSGTTPSAPTSCGSSPSMDASVSTDDIGLINVGSGVVTSCTLNFASPKVNAPLCTCDADSAVVCYVSSRSTTAVIFSLAATVGSGHITYHCFGGKG